MVDSATFNLKNNDGEVKLSFAFHFFFFSFFKSFSLIFSPNNIESVSRIKNFLKSRRRKYIYFESFMADR